MNGRPTKFTDRKGLVANPLELTCVDPFQPFCWAGLGADALTWAMGGTALGAMMGGLSGDTPKDKPEEKPDCPPATPPAPPPQDCDEVQQDCYDDLGGYYVLGKLSPPEQDRLLRQCVKDRAPHCL